MVTPHISLVSELYAWRHRTIPVAIWLNIDSTPQMCGRVSGFPWTWEQIWLFPSPFTVKPFDVPPDIQIELIDSECDSNMKHKFGPVWLDKCYHYIVRGYPKLTATTAKVLSMFGSTYVREQVFSVMNNNKTKQRSRLRNKHLNDNTRYAAAQDFKPDMEPLVKAKWCQVSGVSSSK